MKSKIEKVIIFGRKNMGMNVEFNTEQCERKSLKE